MIRPRTVPVLGICLMACLTLVSRAVPAAGQDSTEVPSVTLLKRIAEAVDARRTGRNVWVVTSVDTMTVTAVLDSRMDAEAMRDKLGIRHRVFGPYRSDVNLGRLDDIIPASCVHDGWSAFMPQGICPPERLANLASISLVFERLDGTRNTVTLPPRINAIFLDLSAFDKFVFPYYERVMGLEPTAAWRASMIEELRRR